MPANKTIGAIFVIIGIVMMIYTGFTYVTTKKLVDTKSLEISRKENHLVQWPPVVGAVLLVGGIVIIVMGRNKT